VADAVARVDRAGALRAQVRMPRHWRAASRGGAELLTVRIGAGQTAVIGAIALGDAGNEERHRLRRSRGLLREHEIRSRHDRHRESQEYQSHPVHIHHLFINTTSLSKYAQTSVTSDRRASRDRSYRGSREVLSGHRYR